MKYTLLVLTILSHLAHASGTSRVIEMETANVELGWPTQFAFSCQPGRSHGFPTASSLLLQNVNIFASTKLNYLVHDDFPNMGDNCAALVADFKSRLPAQMTITRKMTETCIKDDTGRDKSVRKTVSQALSAQVAGYNFGSGDEVLSNIVIENGSCP